MLAEANLQGASLALLHASHCELDKGVIRADLWTLQHGWSSEVIHLPDVVIITGDPVNTHQQAVDAWVRSCRPVIANLEMDKISMCRLLDGTSCEKYVIPWSSVPGADTRGFLSDFLRRQSGAVVKRATGNRGVGLFFVLPGDNDWQLICDSQNVKAPVDELAALIDKRISGRLRYREYIAQRYISSRTSDGRPFDIRVHVQRRADGDWGVTRAYVRLAEAGSPLPNVSRGGYQGALESFLEHRNPQKAEAIEAELRRAAIDIARIQSASAPMPLSELGLDFVIDEEDRVWLIETNAFPETSLHEHARAVNTIGYAPSLFRG
ncbi:hypothetical protein ThidrDRAFT_4276 [Thiorhodococcus drewsii AZ1]|uniref:ATP-grasp domain-containing protein n=1 Tax=Thiorhodococcus drewsii AZ1 TaxID=765913 RepID=G2E7L3_9GAMM|nr:YheC/YheD family protein [Thiorhodococcus drewsii]EGV27897.1 hypothetical protein ThidrDRAFT_4276 [Thiorhodococcus drewsii AZ1]